MSCSLALPASAGGPGGDEADLGPGWRVPADGRGLSRPPVAAPAVGVHGGRHLHAVGYGVLMSLGPLGVELGPCLHEGLLLPASSADDADGGSGLVGHMDHPPGE